MTTEKAVKGTPRKKRKSAASKYYSIPEEELQEIILRAQSGDENAKEQLFVIFANFIQKYVALLYHGKYDLRDYDMRRFIQLWATDTDTKRRLRTNQLTAKTYKQVSEIMNGICYMVQRYNTEEDVMATVKMSFLDCIVGRKKNGELRYKRNGDIPFAGYLYNYMFFILSKNVEMYLIDQLGRHSFPLYTDDAVSSSHSLSEGSDPPQSGRNTPSDNTELIDMLGPMKIDENWVMDGGSAQWPFDQLNAHERQLLKWRFEDDNKASQIARRTTEHANTVRAQLKEIEQKLITIVMNEGYSSIQELY